MAKIKKLSLDIPEYLTIQQYVDMTSYKGDSKFYRLCHTVSILTGEPIEEVEKWDIESLTKVSNLYNEVASHKDLFHPIIEWNGKLYGYANITKSTLGEYIDLEMYSKDLTENMHKIAAILYRPITKTKFNDIIFNIKQGIKVAANKVNNAFDWYEIQKYSLSKVKKVEDDYKNFPVHLFLGGLSFFLSSAGLYLNHIAFSQKLLTEKTMKKAETLMLENLFLSTGDGLQHFTNFQNRVYSQLAEIKQ